MSIYKRGTCYWTQFRTPNGNRIHQSTKTTTRREAQEYEAKLKSSLWRVEQLGEKERMMWDDAAYQYVMETKRGASDDVVSLFKILTPYLSHLYLDQINKKIINNFIEKRKRQKVTSATINKALEKIRTILNKANREWEVLASDVYIKLLPTTRKKIRWLKRHEAIKLINALPPHTAAMCEFSLETGLRESNVTNLRWNQIDLTESLIYIEADDVLKNGKDFVVPLSETAIKIIKQQTGKHLTNVFTYKKKSVKKVSTKLFRKTADGLGLNDFRWHDLRHTWATWHIQNGTPLEILQELGGWTDFKMVKRYAHFSNQHLKRYANQNKTSEFVTTLSPLEKKT